jgi:hypothetical protein
VASCDTGSAGTGFELSSRKANSGSSAKGSFLSNLRIALVLKAHCENVESEVRSDAPWGLGTGPNCRVCALRQALQINLDEATLGKDMLSDKVGTDGGMALRSITFRMTSVFCCTDH